MLRMSPNGWIKAYWIGILIQPADISKYDYINIPARDTWGVIMRKDSPLVKKETIRKEDLLNVPLICSRQAISEERHRNEFADWFGEDFDKLDIVTTFNLVYNAAIMVEAGVGYAITIDKMPCVMTSSSTHRAAISVFAHCPLT